MYNNFQQLVEDSGINLTDNSVKAKLQQFALRLRNKFGFNTRKSDYGYTEETTSLKTKLYNSEASMLKSWRNSSVTWVDDDNNCIYAIVYTAAKYKGRADSIIITKDYL